MNRLSRALKPLAGLLLVAGIGLFASSYWIEAKAVVAQVLLERAWVATLEGEGPVKAWSWADTWPVAALEVPRLGRRVIVLKGSSGEAMAFAPGLMDGTPLPGASGTSIIAAHRDTHFEFLQDVETGDKIQVTLADGTVTWFEATDRRIVYADHSGIEVDHGEGRLALVTCFPFGAMTSGPLRFVIIAERLEPGDRLTRQSASR